MLPALLLFVLWLALYGRLGTYGGFASSASPGSATPASSGSTPGSQSGGGSFLGDQIMKWRGYVFGQ